MLTPVFRCRTDGSGKFIIVDIRLPSIHCKLSTAEFDITNNQFTFHCSPYYLRLTRVLATALPTTWKKTC